MLTILMLTDIIRQDGESEISASVRAELWYKPIMDVAHFADLSTSNRICMFLATVCQESGGLRSVVENLNYSAKGLANTWPSRYAKNPKISPKTPNALANRLNRNPIAIANNVYANRMGNSFEASGDGYKYRGRGPGQITGKDNYRSIGLALDLDLIAQPQLLENPTVGMLACGHHWKRDNLNEIADTGDFKAVTKKWNGGLIGYDDGDRSDKDTRIDYFLIAKKVIPDDFHL